MRHPYLALLALALLVAPAAADDRPNFVIMVADDLGQVWTSSNRGLARLALVRGRGARARLRGGTRVGAVRDLGG